MRSTGSSNKMTSTSRLGFLLLLVAAVAAPSVSIALLDFRFFPMASTAKAAQPCRQKSVQSECSSRPLGKPDKYLGWPVFVPMVRIFGLNIIKMIRFIDLSWRLTRNCYNLDDVWFNSGDLESVFWCICFTACCLTGSICSYSKIIRLIVWMRSRIMI